MQIVAETKTFQSLLSAALSEFSPTVQQSQFSQNKVIRRNGAIMAFGSSKILAAVTASLDLGCQTWSAPSWD
jgi:hypothetical protein